MVGEVRSGDNKKFLPMDVSDLLNFLNIPDQYDHYDPIRSIKAVGGQP